METLFSRLTAQDRPRGMRDVEIDEISTEIVSSMITELIAMIVVECSHLPQGVGRTCRGHMKTCALTVSEEVFQSTPESQALMRDLSSFRAWLTEIELTEMAMTEARKPATGCMSLAQSASAELSELQ